MTLALGIEGTAHTFGAAVVEHESGGARPRIRSNVMRMVRPEKGGIHPREAANQHAEHAGSLIEEALAKAGVSARELDLVGFSQGPGLGPCLRTAATSARALALAAGKPVLGVNHCVAHLEIGRALTEAKDPILLYASGGNTQVIGFVEGRYRVFGETLDVGIGNLLDKFAREVGYPFPGGPEVEKHAKSASGALLDLPYTVKGMDVAFSGILTAAEAHLAKGATLPDVCFSIQETAFAMLVEVTERALAHTEKDEVVLGGGVACNARLRGMLDVMCGERGARAYCPERQVLVDNGAMIAHLALIEHAAGVRQTLAETVIDQRQRTDDIGVTWRPDEPRRALVGASRGDYRGAEAALARDAIGGVAVMRKERVAKSYRHAALDASLRLARGRQEARLLVEARRAGVRTPLVLEGDARTGSLALEFIDAPQVKEVVARSATEGRAALRAFGAAVARLHAADIVHGDLTTSNALVVFHDAGSLSADAQRSPTLGLSPPMSSSAVASDSISGSVRDVEVVLLDFGLGRTSVEAEDKGTDLHVLTEALEATHSECADLWPAFLEGYRAAGGAREVETKVSEIEERGRYRGT
ncbi:MAG: bifunctional N(6)-L-threonylcarbamoyladenine synthase/serine/threonine protein kinase [Thermoplasmatota archaeon]